ncbi:MAG: hypothetical protein M5U17_01975 [Ignavibacterium sp.]|nr:hypothetical protein [Ignavibacterium sp.]
MAISKAGLKQIVACDKGTLSTTPVDPIAMGIRKGAVMKRSHYKPLKDYLDGQFRNMMNFNIQPETMQATMFLLSKMLEWVDGNMDLQVITNPQAAGGTGDVYKFVSGNEVGLDFEYVINSDGRTIKPTFEVALPWAAGQTLVDGADSAAPVTFASITHPRGEDEALLRKPFFVSFEAPSGTPILTRNEIVSRSYSIKTKSKKLEESNMTTVDYLIFELTLKFRNASVAKQIEILNKDQMPTIKLREQNNSTFYDEWQFNSGVLTLNDEFEDSDEDRAITLNFQRNVFIYDIAFEFGTGKGGDATDAGTKGGTMKVGF